MAIDYIIGVLIVLSALVNALALGAFCITPGLQTTANRFVINLLIVNLVGCTALTTSLIYLNGTTIFDYNVYHTNDLVSNSSSDQLITKSFEFTADTFEEIEESESFRSSLNSTNILIQNNASEYKYTEIVENVPIEQQLNSENSRCWGFDITAALGKNLKKKSFTLFVFTYIFFVLVIKYQNILLLLIPLDVTQN